ncbi:MAG: hypothetical protein JO187_10215 [Acidobacteria bacterium]|nr:hypothetical protein [Acidobacteriota bacterium]
MKDVAEKLGNKPATCKKYYIHPAVMDCYSSGTLHEFAEKFRSGGRNYAYESMVLSLLTPLKHAKAKKVA